MTPRNPTMSNKTTLKDEILEVITENFMEMILDTVNKMYKIHSRNFKTPKIKNVRGHINK
jgi:hypothetical protein